MTKEGLRSDPERGRAAVPPREEDLGRASIYYVVRFLVRVVAKRCFGGQCHHSERIPETGPAIFACTHQSVLDPLLLAAFSSRPQCFLARDSLFRIPGFGWLLAKLGAVPVRRGAAGARAGLRLCIRILERDRVLVLFPEGTRSRDGKLQPLKTGIAFVARGTGAPVVPTLAVGTFAAWPRHRKLPRPAPVSLYFGVPLTYRDRESFGSFVERLASAYRDLAREAGAEDMLDEESGPGEDAGSTPAHRRTSTAEESDTASLRITPCFSQV